MLSGFMFSPDMAKIGARSYVIEPTENIVIEEVKPPTETYEAYSVEVYEWDTAEIVQLPPELQKIAKCESENKHFNDDGTVLRGRVNPNDVGRFQINLDAWGERAEELGLDVFDEADNIRMALYIFYEEGIHHWRYSKSCWG